MKRPAETLVEEFDKIIQAAADVVKSDDAVASVEVPIPTVKRWRSLAKKIDARMRLDGSKLNRRKKAAK